MASARRKGASKVQIYQDPDESIEDSELARTLQNYTNSFEAAHEDVTNTSIVLGPPADQASLSPLKRSSPQSSPRLQVVDQNIFDSVSFPPPTHHLSTDSPTKKNVYAPYFAPVSQKPQKGLFTTFSTSGGAQKETRHLSISGIPSFSTSDPLYASMPSFSKRANPDTAYIERPVKRVKVQEDPPGPLPDPEDMPSVPDENGKPNYSYAQLIGMAILRATDRKMTLSQIYKWISDSFSFYRDGQAGSGWQNSIRHNLSLNKAFVKKERPKEDPGKGNYWAIQDGLEAQFYKDKTFRRPPTADQAYFEPPLSDTCPLPVAASAPAPTKTLLKPLINVDSSGFPTESISSDATVPMSDQVEDQPRDTAPPAPRPVSPSIAPMSSPPPDLNSSPPIPRHTLRQATPAHLRHSSMSRSGDRKKRYDSFKDSGFYSSIESSIPRAPVGPLLTSEADHRSSAFKRGRAEEEIARMRGSSFDPSPTKARQTFKKPRLEVPANSSSPIRGGVSHIGFPPLTPGLKLHPPSRAPPTVSPGTHLRRHRESIRDLVGTPGQKELAAAEEIKFTPSFIFADENAWSPQFSPNRSAIKPTPLKQQLNLDDISRPASDENKVYSYPLPDLPGEDSDGEECPITSLDDAFADDSPISKKARRPMHRSATSTSALQDISKSRMNIRLGSPIRLSPPKKGAGAHAHSPAKQTIHPKNDVFLGAVSSSDDERINDIDLTKGFRSIGPARDKENALALGVPLAPSKGQMNIKTTRPPLGRSSTNLL